MEEKGPEKTSEKPTPNYFVENEFQFSELDSELIIGLVGAVGTDLPKVEDIIKGRLESHQYNVNVIHVSMDIIKNIYTVKEYSSGDDEYERISRSMDAGKLDRNEADDYSILAMGAAFMIWSKREKDASGNGKPCPNQAYIINSLKHPDEVHRLRQIYPQGFYLIGVYCDEKRRLDHLVENKRIGKDKAQELMDRDKNENLPYGQKLSDTFHMSDFFIKLDGNDDKLKNDIWRILEILFADPYKTPTFDEYAMFLAHTASLRSADLSRQVGAVVSKDKEIIGTGANDCPRFGGGLYWPVRNDENFKIEDEKNGRDYMRSEDPNKREQSKIINDIVKKGVEKGIDEGELRETLESSPIRDLIEFGRVVHAEMEALLSCARNGISTNGATLYCTTFPCHNCAKHIIAAGIERVVYIEPYEKSKAQELHDDAISLGFSGKKRTVHFEPFIGVGPRRFFDLFSMNLGSGTELKRKDKNGKVVEWKPENSNLRIRLRAGSYLDLELTISNRFRTILERLSDENER